MAILVIELYVTPLGVQCQIKASPKHAPCLAFNSGGKPEIHWLPSQRTRFQFQSLNLSPLCSGCIVWTLVISVGCSMLGFCAASGLCLLLCTCHNHRTDYQIIKKKKMYTFSFLVRLSIFRLSVSQRESEDADLKEEGVEDDLRLLLFLDLYLLLDWSLLEIRPEREVCKVCCPISVCC